MSGPSPPFTVAERRDLLKSAVLGAVTFAVAVAIFVAVGGFHL